MGVLGFILAILTVGESLHASHHESPRDYRLGREWWEVDLGRCVIEGLARLGLITDLRMPKIAPKT